MSRARLGAGLLFVLGLAACGGGGSDPGGGNPVAPPTPAPPPPAVVTRVVVTPATATVEVGKTMVFQAQAQDVNGAPVASTITWESSDLTKATIDANGVATGVSVGPAAITALAGAVRSTVASLAITAATQPSGPSSFEKIDAALSSGAIDLATAIVYKMFATFRDVRLPAQYQGNDNGQAESDAFDLAHAHWSTLSDAVKETLEPFLVPPAYAGSWAVAATALRAALARPQSLALPICRQPTLDPNWAAKPATQNGRVKVWYDTRIAGANTKADMLLTEFETKIWPTLIDTVGMKAPLSDGALTGCNGGDGRLDVYLVDMAVHGQTGTDLGETFSVQPATRQHPAFILINRTLADDEMKAAAAHEFMHASQWAYPVAATALSSYRWLKEASAQWGIDGVYGSTLQIEQRKAPPYMDSPDLSLESEEKGMNRVYGSYLFFQFLARTVRPGVIADVWNTTASQAEQVMAVDKGIPGGFKEQWPKFAKLLWNQDPVNTNSFEGWDGLTLAPTVRGGGITNINLGGQGGATQILNGNIKHLATHYYHLRVNDPNVRALSFFNHFYAIAPVPETAVTTQVFFKKQGSIWQYEHWSDEGLKEGAKQFCLDLVAERVEEIVIAVSNAHPTRDILDLADAVAPRISASNVGCWRYKGTASVSEDVTTSTGTYVGSADATVTFERWRPAQTPDGAPGREMFAVQSGAVTARSTHTDLAGCTLTRRAGGSLLLGVAGGSLDVELGLDVGTNNAPRRVGGTGGGPVLTHSELVCPNVPPVITDNDNGWDWLEFPAPTEMAVDVKPDGTIQGSFTRPYPAPFAGTRTMIWNLVPQRQ